MHEDWSLDIKKMSWVEHTVEEVDFIIEALALRGGERVLDLACGFGRHSLELARRGYKVVGVDITPEYIADARRTAQAEGLAVEFIQADVREVAFRDEFDVTLNMADGAIGYFESDAENLRLFDVIARSLRRGGVHVMGICSADHAIAHFPKRHWQAGRYCLSLADFRWNAATSRMLYRGHLFEFGQPLKTISDSFPEGDADAGTRLYTMKELEAILAERGMTIMAAYGAYDTCVPFSADHLMQVVCARKD